MQKIPFNQNWRFKKNEPLAFLWDVENSANWKTLDLPHDWSIQGDRKPDNPSSNLGGYFPMGFAWYEKTFEAPEEWRGKKVTIEFEGVFMNAEVWINNHPLGIHPYGYTSFYHDISPYLSLNETNTVRVSVDNSHPLNARWYSGSGIYRPVWLWIGDLVHIPIWGVFITTPEVSDAEAVVHIETRLENSSPDSQEISLLSILTGQDGSTVQIVETPVKLAPLSRETVTQELRVANPRLWSPDEPALYQLTSTLSKQGIVLDTTTTVAGIRSLAFSAKKGFLLNGQPLKLKGGCVHHDNGILGAASYPRSEERKVEVHKASGYNAIRCAHNPPAPSFLEACDRLGMLVIDEAFDVWREGKNPGDYHLAFDDWWQRDLDSMLYRDRNHPSVILWSIGNELMERGKPAGVAIAKMLAEHVRSVDPTRPVIAANCEIGGGRPWADTDPFFSILDISGYNYQYKNYQPDHERLPQRMMIGTESTPMEAFDHWMLVKQHPYILGDFVWTSLDYLGESGIGHVYYEGNETFFLPQYPWHQANCGDLDLCGFKRPQSYYRDILWEQGKKIFLAVHPPLPEGKTLKLSYWGWPDVWRDWNWEGLEGKIFKVDVYSACEQVELFLNGKSLGSQPSTVKERFITSFEVPYEPGVLKAIGISGGQQVETDEIPTAGKPVQLRLTADRPHLSAGDGDLSFITVEVLDSQSYVHPSAQNEIFFTIQGEGSILAVGNSDPRSTERYTGNSRKAHRGRCMVVVKSNGGSGQIRLLAQADGLAEAEVQILVGQTG